MIIGKDPWVHITLITKFDCNQVQKNEQINKSIMTTTNRKRENNKNGQNNKNLTATKRLRGKK